MKVTAVTIYCQCRSCLETFDLDVEMSGNMIVKVDGYSRIHVSRGHIYHRCGGISAQLGEVMFVGANCVLPRHVDLWINKGGRPRKDAMPVGSGKI